MPTITMRLPARTNEELRSFFDLQGLGPSEGVRRIVEEFWATKMFEHIEFRDVPNGRRAALCNGPEIWEIISYRRDYGGDEEGFKAHFGWISPAALDAAVEYYNRYPDDVDKLIIENDRYERFLSERLGSEGDVSIPVR